MTRQFLRLAILATMIVASTEGCATTSGRLYVRTGPPRPVVERRIVAPGPDYVWQSGFYRWTGRDYVWVPGHYERAPRPRARWIEGRWAHDRRGWYFIEGHWS